MKERSFAMGTGTRTVVLAMIAVCLSGCGAVPQSKYYELAGPREAVTPAVSEPLPLTLLVGPLRGSHLYREDRLVYASSNEEMGTYQSHRWVQPPTEMMQELLWRSLRGSRGFHEVYLLSSNSHGDFLLQGSLYDFKEISGSPLMARVSLELELKEIKTGAVVWTHEYTHDEPVNGKDVPAVVAALDQNAQRGVSESVAGLHEYLAAKMKR